MRVLARSGKNYRRDERARDVSPALVSSPADVMVTIWNEESVNESIALANELRSRSLRVDLYPEADKLGKQFKYASSRGIPFVLIRGDDERAKAIISIKNMKTGGQFTLPFESVPDTEQITEEQKAKSKGSAEGLLRWLRDESTVGEADDSIKPGA